jgi:uncharacterized membrane protein YgcG
MGSTTAAVEQDPRRRTARRTPAALLVLLGLVVLSSFTAHAQAQTTDSVVAQAARALAQDPVYVDPAAQSILDPGAAARLRTKVGSMNAGPVYIAVLGSGAEAEAEAGGSMDGLVGSLRRQTGRDGIYIVIAGNKLRALGPGGTSAEIGPLADAAVRDNRGKGAEAVLTALLDGIQAQVSGGSGPAGPSDPNLPPFEPGVRTEPGPASSPIPLLIGIAGLGGIVAAAVVASNRRRRVREAAELEEVRRTVLEDLVSLGDALRSVDLDVRMPGADPQAATDYERALSMYEQASSALDRARRADDVGAVTSAIDDGRYAVEAAKARLEGREPPERRPPCFFDPRHGHSTADVEWAPPNGAPRTIPVCAADAQRIAEGIDPEPRRVGVGGTDVPYWDAPRHYGPWYGGYYGGGGGLLQGFLLGSLMSGGWGSHYSYGDQTSVFGGGEGGGGDFGGGDFGGGDFGGGDFGGGDFGGGDF